MTRRLTVLVATVLAIVALGSLYATASENPLQGYVGSIQTAVTLVDEGNTQDALALLNSLAIAITTAREELTGWSFTGQADLLTDPFVLPAGVYRAHFKTAGYGIVEVMPLDDSGYVPSLFAVNSGEASQEVSTIYRSQGDTVLIQFSAITAPYTLVFERLK